MLKKTEENTLPHEALERIYHSPGRTAIMAAVCAAGKAGVTFSELKEACNLTDGNLNAHLTALVNSGAVRMKKEFVGVKPRTTVFLTKAGLDGFTAYLDALQAVLRTSRASLAPAKKARSFLGRAATA